MRITKYINAIQWRSLFDRCETFEPHGIYGYQISYLIAVHNYPGLSQEDLRESMFVNKSTVARNIKTLADMGLVYSEIDEKDKRINRIYPTEKLKDFFPIIDEFLDKWNKAILSDLTDKEKDVFIQLLEKVAKKAISSKEEGLC